MVTDTPVSFFAASLAAFSVLNSCLLPYQLSKYQYFFPEAFIDALLSAELFSILGYILLRHLLVITV